MPSPRPEWLKIKVPAPEVVNEVMDLIRSKALVTVCEEARCPNLNECWGVHRTATFMLMGDVCTRHCSFCSVTKGQPGVLDSEEPQRLAEAVATLKLKFAVVTSVNRDDLPDGGAEHFQKTIQWIRTLNPDCGIEVLIPDFQGSPKALHIVLEAQPEVLNHNIETIPRLYKRVRPDADYHQSMKLLDSAHQYRLKHNPSMKTKSGIMLGLGETTTDIIKLMEDWYRVGVDIITLGQYLPPTPNHLPVERFVEPGEFDMYRQIGESMGFTTVQSGPLVRSSYHARESFGTPKT
jgi:lipoic acid synthetase